jgi:hypothetical protein
LTTRFTILSILLILIGAAGMSLGQPLNNLGIIGDAGASQEKATTMKNASEQGIVAEATNDTNSTVGLNYIWAITGLEPSQVIMVLDQENEALYGAAKYEPDNGQPWNAIVIGSISGDDVDLVITPTTVSEQGSFKMAGIFDAPSQSIKGSFFQIDVDRISARGNFEAVWINPDTSSYIPANIQEPKAAASISSDAVRTAAANVSNQTYPQQSSQTSRFHNVREDADRILTGVGDLSQIPIGMGGSGLGGGSSIS